MRHLLEVLRKDFEKPAKVSTCSSEQEKKGNGVLDAFLPHLESGRGDGKTQEKNDLFPYASLIKYCDSPGYSDRVFVSTPLCSPETTLASKRNDKGREDENLEKDISSPWLVENVPDNTLISEEDLHQDQIGTAVTNEVNSDNRENASVISDTGLHQNQAEDIYDGPSKEIEDLGRNLSESLHVSGSTHNNSEENTEHHTDMDASVSDDEF